MKQRTEPRGKLVQLESSSEGAAPKPEKMPKKRASPYRPFEKLATWALEGTGKLQKRLFESNVHVHRNVPYVGSGRKSHLLDVYVPEGKRGPLPVILYVHGGAFVFCSKETHYMMGQLWAREGFVVFNINYRLAPQNPYPAAVEDVCEALRWVHDNAQRFGGDPRRIVLAGESAGANLVTAVTIACCSRRPEPWARAVFDAGIVPRAVVAGCGILQVSHARRFSLRHKLPAVARRILHLLPDSYVDLSKPWQDGELDLLDPLLVLESGYRFERPLPGFFMSVGTADPLLDDTRRMALALARRSVPNEARYYPGEIHAFNLMHWRAAAKQAMEDSLRFVDAQLRTARLVRVAG